MDQTHTDQKCIKQEAEHKLNNHSVLSNFVSQFLYHPLSKSSHSNAQQLVLQIREATESEQFLLPGLKKRPENNSVIGKPISF